MHYISVGQCCTRDLGCTNIVRCGQSGHQGAVVVRKWKGTSAEGSLTLHLGEDCWLDPSLLAFSIWTSQLLGSLSWSWGRGRRDLNELRKIWIAQMLNSHSLHIPPGWHHLVGEYFHSLSWAGYATNSCAVKATKVVKLIVIDLYEIDVTESYFHSLAF